MKRVFYFDHTYLKEFKEQVFNSDYDEVKFAMFLILDLTRLLVENESMSGRSDNEKMTLAFSFLKGKIGIIIPFRNYIVAYHKLLCEALKARVNADENDILIGTPDMFRGVEKDLIIVSTLRNSVIDGLGYFD